MQNEAKIFLVTRIGMHQFQFLELIGIDKIGIGRNWYELK